MKVLIIEDEKNIVDPIARILSKKGFQVDIAYDGQEGLHQVGLNEYDCIVLDLNLPKIDGIAVAKQLAEKKITTPILMLTARSQIYDKLTGFESGADDYLTKPFDMQELIARISALIRRNSKNTQLTLEIGNSELDPAQNMLHIKEDNECVQLSNKETGILEYLIRNKGRVVSAEELLQHVWDSNVNLFTDTIKTHMKTLRAKMGKDGELIKTIKGKGYIIV